MKACLLLQVSGSNVGPAGVGSEWCGKGGSVHCPAHTLPAIPRVSDEFSHLSFLPPIRFSAPALQSQVLHVFSAGRLQPLFQACKQT